MTRTNAQAKTTPKPAAKTRRARTAARAVAVQDRHLTDLVAGGVATNASTALRFVCADVGVLPLSDMVASMREHGEAINRGDLATAERMLNAQAVALNAMFAELARRAAMNMGTHLQATETYLRLALKSQSQCRATVEALAAIKNPPVVFARQANINNGGQQQVNNGPETPGAQQFAPASAHAGKSAFEPSELLEDRTHGSPPLDTRATAAAGRPNQDLEPVGAFNRPANR